MVLVLFKNLTECDKEKSVEHLIQASTPSQDFFFMTILSIITATLGLLLNNVAVITGSMLIAPMLYPFLSLSLGISLSDMKLVSRAFYTILKSWTLGVIVSTLTTLLFASHFQEITPEIFSRTHATLPYMIIAIAAGLAGSFALVKPQLNETLPGIAISVALIPPIAVTGIGIAYFSWPLVGGSILLFIVNAIGIVFSGIITFSMMNFYVKRTIADKTIRKEDAKVKREIKRAEKQK